MKSLPLFFARSLFLILLLVPLSLWGEKVWTAETFPMVHLQAANRYVCDPDGVLQPSVRDSMDALLFQLERQKGVQTVVAVARRIEGGDAYEFGMALARKYGVGSKKQNSGLIFVLSTEDRSYYILTGTGLEGTLPDAVCSRIKSRYLLPRLKEGDWNGAMLSAVRAACGYIEKDPGLTAELQGDENDDDAPLTALLFVVFMSVIIYICIKQNKKTGSVCPKCGHSTLVYTGQSIRFSTTRPNKRKYIYKCSHCGYTETRDDDPNDGHRRSSSSLFPFIFMGGGNHSHGGGFGGGGFGGGSFGGGSFGGGGAGGRF